MIYKPRPDHRPVIHLIDCPCADCNPPVPGERDLSWSEIGAWSLAGCLTANVIAFVTTPHGAWHALASAAVHLLGVR